MLTRADVLVRGLPYVMFFNRGRCIRTHKD